MTRVLDKTAIYIMFLKIIFSLSSFFITIKQNSFKLLAHFRMYPTCKASKSEIGSHFMQSCAGDYAPFRSRCCLCKL